jgi:hypothetical protein
MLENNLFPFPSYWHSVTLRRLLRLGHKRVEKIFGLKPGKLAAVLS